MSLFKFFLMMQMGFLTTKEALSQSFDIQSSPDLVVGTFFGSNWAEVEQEARNKLVDSISTLQDSCSISSIEYVSKGVYPLSCGIERATYCGFNPEENINDIMSRLMFLESIGFRHLFSNCETNMEGIGCQLKSCLFDCIREISDALIGVSDSCREAAEIVQEEIVTTTELEKFFDTYEAQFRQNLAMISLYSALASFLVIYLSRSVPRDQKEKSSCTMFFMALNWGAALSMICFVAVVCPVFLVVILPPFAIVQVIYYTCFARSPSTTVSREDTDVQCDYHLVQDLDSTADKSQPKALQPLIYSGIPIRVV